MKMRLFTKTSAHGAVQTIARTSAAKAVKSHRIYGPAEAGPFQSH